MSALSVIVVPVRRFSAGAAALVLLAGLFVVVLAAEPATAAPCNQSGKSTATSAGSSSQVSVDCADTDEASGTGGRQAAPVNLDPNREVCFYRPSKGGVYHEATPPAGKTAADGQSMDRFCGKASHIAAMMAAADPVAGCSAPCGAQYGVWVPNGTAPTPQEVATSLLATLDLAAPKIHTSPEADQRLVVNLPTWLWVDGARSDQSASDGPISLTAHQTVKWSTDAGAVPCTGAGTPYVHGKSDPLAPSPDCGFTFRAAGPHTITAVVTWTITVNGADVTLPASVFTVTRDVQVDPIQTVNR